MKYRARHAERPLQVDSINPQFFSGNFWIDFNALWDEREIVEYVSRNTPPVMHTAVPHRVSPAAESPIVLGLYAARAGCAWTALRVCLSQHRWKCDIESGKSCL
jgi:hypothetical protein